MGESWASWGSLHLASPHASWSHHLFCRLPGGSQSQRYVEGGALYVCGGLCEGKDPVCVGGRRPCMGVGEEDPVCV